MSSKLGLKATLEKNGARIALTLLPLALILLAVTGVFSNTFFDQLDNAYYDARLRLTMPQTQAKKVAIVDVDERSLAELGRWPWSRDKLAQLITHIFDKQKAAALGIDMVLAEPDTSSGLGILENLAHGELASDPAFVARVQALHGQLNYDAQLASVMRRYPIALGYYFTSDRAGRKSGQLPPPVMSSQDLQGRRVRFVTWDGYGANLPEFTQATAAAGFFNAMNSPDGVVRSMPLLSEYDGHYYESLPLALLRLASGKPSISPGFPPEYFFGKGSSTLESVHLNYKNGVTVALPVDAQVSTFVPYRGHGGPQGSSFEYFSASDILQDKTPAGSLQGKLVLLGTTAPGLLDLRVTPVGGAYPGVEVHANVLEGFLNGNVPVRPDYAVGYEVVILTLTGLLLSMALPLLSALRGMTLAGVCLLLTTGLNTWLYLQWHLVLPIASVLILIISTVAFHALFGYFVANRSKRELARLFGSYVPSELVDEMLKDPKNYSMLAQNKEMTVMFCDVRGFTKMAEDADPLQVQALLNRVFGHLTEIIRANGGTIDKYMGDCVMAFWGAPVATSEHPQLALRCALQIIQALPTIQTDLQTAQLVNPKQAAIAVSISLNSGIMCVGNMGTELRQAYTVIGDEVNLAARLEPLSRIYSVDIIATEAMRSRNPDWVWQELDLVQVKGRQTPERIFTPIALRTVLAEEQRSELKTWAQFLKAYRAGQVDSCEMYLFNLTRKNPQSPLYTLYTERLQVLRTGQPSNWQGISVMGPSKYSPLA